MERLDPHLIMDGDARPRRPDALAVLDVGTTSTRAFVLRLDGSVVAESRLLNALETPTPERIEQDPIALRAAAETVVAQAVTQARSRGVSVRGLVLSTHMHSVLVTDTAGMPLTPLITWADTRADAQATVIRSHGNWPALYARTGCPPHASYPLYKLMALRASGAAPNPSDRVTDLKGWLIHGWTGARIVDRSIASGSGLLELRTLRWDAGALELAGVTEDQLPVIVDTTHHVPCVTERLGLRLGRPIVVGAGDGVLSSLGSGAQVPGVGAVMVGTSGAVRIPSPMPVADAAGRLFSYYLADGRWIVGGGITNGGLVLDRLGGILGLDAAQVLDAAADAPPGAGGLIMLPLLAGERAPGYDARARGAWFGLGLDHDRRHLARAALEGVAFSVRSVLEVAEEATGRVAEIRVTGGLARSPLWLQTLAGVLDRPVSVPVEVEGSTVGALALGAVALGLQPDLDTAAAPMVRVAEVVRPVADDAAVYASSYALYRRLYRSLSPEFATLTGLRAMTSGTERT